MRSGHISPKKSPSWTTWFSTFRGRVWPILKCSSYFFSSSHDIIGLIWAPPRNPKSTIPRIRDHASGAAHHHSYDAMTSDFPNRMPQLTSQLSKSHRRADGEGCFCLLVNCLRRTLLQNREPVLQEFIRSARLAL